MPRMRGVDIYAHGSGNPGTTNVLRSMGRKTAAAVMVGDMAKGCAAAALAGISSVPKRSVLPPGLPPPSGTAFRSGTDSGAARA